MKTLILCYEYPPVGGGGGRVAAVVGTGLAAAGHEVRVLTARAPGLPASELRDGVPIERITCGRKSPDTCSVPEMGLYVAAGFFPAWKLCRQWKPDVIHAHFAVPTGALAWAISRLTGIPYVLTAHLGDVPGGVPEQTAGLFRWVKPFTNPIWHGAAATTAVSSFVNGLARAAYRVDPQTIPNGIFLPSAAPPLYSGPELRLLMLGRLSVQKNPLLAVQALALLKDTPWHLDVIGDGPLRGEMESAVRKNGLGNRITFHGWQNSGQIQTQMARSHALLMTSHQEGMPMAAIEALSGGLAILSTDIGGVQDVAHSNKNALLFAPTPDSAAAAIRILIDSPERRAALQAASWKLAAEFDLVRIIPQYERVLKQAAGIASSVE